MLCRRCTQRDSGARAPRLTEPRLQLRTRPNGAGGTGRRTDGQCSGCGGPLDPDALTERVIEKWSQLAQFGLADREDPLLKARKRRKE